MKKVRPNFLTFVGDSGEQFISASLKAMKNRFARPANITAETKNMCTFLDDSIDITKLATTIFSSDLTPRDDVILAILSVTIILVVESILTTILLRRTHYGNVSNIGFSVKQFVAQAREFRLRYLIKGAQGGTKRQRHVSYKVLLLASGILAITFGIEVAILFLTNPHRRLVTNQTASLQLAEVVNPDWNKVRKTFASPVDRPCTDILFRGVHQERTRVTLCLTSSVSVFKLESFTAPTEEEVVIISDMHEFGAEHLVSIGGRIATFSARGYYRLGKGGDMMLSERERLLDKASKIEFVHRQYAAFLLNLYSRERGQKIGDEDLNALNGIKFNHTRGTGQVIDVIRLNDKLVGSSREVVSTRHITTFKAVLPSGNAAYRVAQVLFKGATAVGVTGPDIHDLGTVRGNTVAKVRIEWEEEVRTLNWLSLSLLFFAALASLFVLRYLMRPVATSDIAGVLVRKAVGARHRVSPTLLAEDEKKHFFVGAYSSRISSSSDNAESESDPRSDPSDPKNV